MFEAIFFSKSEIILLNSEETALLLDMQVVLVFCMITEEL